MKKSLLALAVAAMAASSVASAATVYNKDGDTLNVYGRVQGVMYSTHQAGYNTYNDSSLQATGRLGFDMRTQLTKGVAGFAKMEWDVADKSDSFRARYAFLGADFGQYGVVKAGRFEDAVKYVVLATDIYDDYGCFGQFANGPKRDGVIMYTWSGFGVDVNASFQTAQDGQELNNVNWGKANNKVDVDHAFGLSAGYKSAPVLFGPIAVKAGFALTQIQEKGDNKLTENKDGVLGYWGSQADIDTVKDWAVSASWGDLAKGPYVAAMYNARTTEFVTANTEDFDAQGFEFAVAYGFENGISLRTGYMYKNVEQGVNEASMQIMPVYVNYQLNPRFNVWAEARFDVGTDEGSKTEPSWKQAGGQGLLHPAYSVGARYVF